MLLDTLLCDVSGGKLSYDKDGSLAASGATNQTLLEELLEEPYFKLRPPKSTGRELFGGHLYERIKKRISDTMTHADTASTLLDFTVTTIYDAIYNMPNVTCIKKAIEDSDFKPYFTLVILATDDIEVQERSAFVCRKAGILVNRCDLPEDGDFITASVLNKPPVSAAVTASRVPAMARLVRKRFEKHWNRRF